MNKTIKLNDHPDVVVQDSITYRCYTASELAAGDFQVSFLIEGVLVENQPTMFIAPQKTMKTTVSIDLAMSLATGKKFLDRFTVSKLAPTLLMTGESGLATVKETSTRIAASKGMNLEDVVGFAVSDQIPLLYDVRHMASLEKLLDTLKPRVLIADPVYLMVNGENAGNLFSMGAQLKPAAKMCQDRGITFILVHHAKQSSQNAKEYQPLELQDASWTGFAEFARQWLLLSRRERYEPGTGDHRLWFSYGGSAGHSGLWGLNINEGANTAFEGRDYIVEVEEAREARQEAASEAARKRDAQKQEQAARRLQHNGERILSALRDKGESSASQLRTHLGMSGDAAGRAIDYLLESKSIERKQVEIKGTLRDVYRTLDCIGQHWTP